MVISKNLIFAIKLRRRDLAKHDLQELVCLPCSIVHRQILKAISSKQRDGVVVRASTSHSVDSEFIPLVESYQKILKNGIYSFSAWRSTFMGGCGEQAGKFACVLVQGTEQEAPPSCGRQVTRKWQLPSECGLAVQNIAMHRFFVNGG